jgi:hypothetical protein
VARKTVARYPSYFDASGSGNRLDRGSRLSLAGRNRVRGAAARPADGPSDPCSPFKLRQIAAIIRPISRRNGLGTAHFFLARHF